MPNRLSRTSRERGAADTMNPDDLRAWRNSRGLSQRAAAEALGVNVRNLQGLESGRSPTSPLWPVLAKLTAALDELERVAA